MAVSKEAMTVAKEKISQYYQSRTFIELQKLRLQKMERHFECIEADRKSAYFPFGLSTDMKGVSYDNVIVKGGKLPASPMENEIEKICTRLDIEYEKTLLEILNTKQQIRKAEENTETMGLFIAMLNAEYQKALELYFKKTSITRISMELHIAKSTVCKYLNNIYNEIASLIEYYE